MKRILSVVFSVALLAGVFAACTPADRTPPPTEGTVAGHPPPPPPDGELGRRLIMAAISEPPAVAPGRHTAIIGQFLNMSTHNGIFRFHYDDLLPLPDLIESYTALSDTLFEFRLHEGILFHNGEVMTAHDVITSLTYLRNYPEAVTAHGSIYAMEVVDRYTFRLDTGVPNAMLFFDLAHHGNMILPASLIESGHDFQADPVGSGPFVFDHWQFGDSIHFNAFPYYFDRERAPRIEGFVWRAIPEGASRTIALEMGEIDYIVDVPFPDIPRLQENPNVTVFYRPGVAFNMMEINNTRPFFDNINVRRALDMALDKEAMVSAAFDGWAIPNWVMVPPQHAGASREGIRSFDPEGARALLAQEGIGPGDFEFDLIVTNEAQRRMAEVAQSNLADVGINISISTMDFAAWLGFHPTGNFDANLGGFTGQGNLLNFMRTTMHIASINAQNISRVYNHELSGLIDQAIATIDPVERIAVLYEATRVANEHVGFIPTHMSILLRAFNSDLISPEIAANGMMFLNMVYWVD